MRRRGSPQLHRRLEDAGDVVLGHLARGGGQEALLLHRALDERVEVARPEPDGGQPGRAGEQFAVRPDGAIQPLLAKAANQPLFAGETFVLRTSGGGGLGPPEARARERIEADLVEGFVTAEGAR